ncbi:FdtA/QdtA family cupin domain-containing protein [Clostridium sp.]|uniref:sugar 3,4-ketoisomerase n=1 Tax=Clostridium sp. TaxID=1506 RepID=UPI0032166DF2
MYNVSLLKFKNIKNQCGNLTPVEGKTDIPFKIRRIYYISNVPEGISRGFHSHRKLHQVLICLNGSVKIRVKNPKEEEVIELNNPSIGLYIGNKVWREMFDFKDNAILLALASEYYDENDYIRNYDSYIEDSNKNYD